MKVAVTGATGFIGGVVCRRLVSDGYEVLAMRVRAGERVAAFAGASAVVHLAGLAHRRDADAAELERANVELARALGEAGAASGARMIFMSSIKVHGNECEQALRHSSPFAPQDEYGASKAAAEAALRAIARLRLTVIRPPLVYGPGVRANFLALLNAVARGWPLPFASIANRRSLLYVDNLADLVVRCLREPASIGRAYVPCDGEPLSTPQLCRELAQNLRRPARLFRFPPRALELLPGARRLTRSLYADAGEVERELAWRAPTSRAQALQATARWFASR